MCARTSGLAWKTTSRSPARDGGPRRPTAGLCARKAIVYRASVKSPKSFSYFKYTTSAGLVWFITHPFLSADDRNCLPQLQSYS